MGADAAGGREQQALSGLAFHQGRYAGRHEIIEPLDGVLAGEANLPPRAEIEVLHRSGRIAAVEVPSTLLVTNDYPPRVGGVQRTLHALVEQFLPDRIAVLAPKWEGWREHDAAQPYPIYRYPVEVLWPTTARGLRARSVARATGAEVALV